nr:hypothetical protein [uncultured Schaedlerella sp.]
MSYLPDKSIRILFCTVIIHFGSIKRIKKIAPAFSLALTGILTQNFGHLCKIRLLHQNDFKIGGADLMALFVEHTSTLLADITAFVKSNRMDELSGGIYICWGS